MIKLKTWQIVLLIVIIAVILGLIFGFRLAAAGGLGALLFGFGTNPDIKKREKEIEQAEKERDKMREEHDKEIAEAGEDIEAKEYTNADDARDGINDFFNGDS